MKNSMTIAFPAVPFDVIVKRNKVFFICRRCGVEEKQSDMASATSIWWMEYLVAFGGNHNSCKLKRTK